MKRLDLSTLETISNIYTQSENEDVQYSRAVLVGVTGYT